VRAFDNNEHGLFTLRQDVGEHEAIRWLLGDVRDLSRLQRACEGIDVVFHTAALKHVLIGEYNPFEIVQTNLLGLENVIQACLGATVERMLFTSSDKAVNPTNAMGASKLMGERLVAAAANMKGQAGTEFASVRFGNVLGSNGSVVPLFARQIREGGPVTLTDSRMTRFVMALQDAVTLVVRAAHLARDGNLFVLKMPAISIRDLAHVMVERLAGTFGHHPDRIKVIEVGPKKGEKLHEELLTDTEVPVAWENDELIVCDGLGDDSARPSSPQCGNLQGLSPVQSAYRSDRVPLLTPPQIDALLTRCGFLPSPGVRHDERMGMP
jgi:FlaA1/EpsC-like NDP-sugar epimerase